MKLQVKKDPWVIVPYTVFTVAIFAIFAFTDKLSLSQLLSIFAALNLASVFGMERGEKGGGDGESGGKSESERPSQRDTIPPPPGAHKLILFIVPALLCVHFIVGGLR